LLGFDVREPENLYRVHAALRAGDVLHAASSRGVPVATP
jgi:hypothetical protein